ncbi:hypothetical protein HMPREF9413_4385 [Paenibacillus sp. HGF7]|nr:hypothetical protein HMPREF9413_4385 [Paenibacillus sp. HGF7]
MSVLVLDHTFHNLLAPWTICARHLREIVASKGGERNRAGLSFE